MIDVVNTRHHHRPMVKALNVVKNKVEVPISAQHLKPLTRPIHTGGTL